MLFTDSGKEALRWCERYAPDVVLTDLLLSDMEGLELIRQIEGLESSTSPYKIVMSEYQEEYTEVAAFQCGADDFISKPVRIRALMRRLEAVVRSRGGKNITDIIQGTRVSRLTLISI